MKPGIVLIASPELDEEIAITEVVSSISEISGRWLYSRLGSLQTAIVGRRSSSQIRSVLEQEMSGR